MRIDDTRDDAPEVVNCMRLVYEVAALQRANAETGMGIISVGLRPHVATLTVMQSDDVVDIEVGYDEFQREALRGALVAKGLPARSAPPDDETFGIPDPTGSRLTKHAWITKMVAFGADPGPSMGGLGQAI
ncbi:hypothetical protein [Sphaerisporangium corydalis]|uniref:Uncharacterized protein n=1 Tax=Sphaerisporangium corydalis TaxID=1441875 RepID=A0ABV9EBT4_9ACTN|nr:hypothetical protein [Sphaerisporangium corydalis]